LCRDNVGQRKIYEEPGHDSNGEEQYQIKKKDERAYTGSGSRTSMGGVSDASGTPGTP
jgi:hypothetical protein